MSLFFWALALSIYDDMSRLHDEMRWELLIWRALRYDDESSVMGNDLRKVTIDSQRAS
jgi:hypothetical protein